MALADRIIGAESGGNATARNPRSSATGAGQFIDGTWLSMIGKYRPDLAGLPRDQVLGLRNDPGLSREMVDRYGDENGAMLRGAGLPDTDGTRYLAHFAGPAGAKSVLSADPSTPVSQLLPASSIAANGFLQGKSAGWLTDWAASKVGGAAPSMTMPGSLSGPGAFTLSGPGQASIPGSVTPVDGAAMQAPAPDDSLDVAALLRTLTAGQASPAAAAQSAQPSAPMSLAPPRRAAQPFDAGAYLARLARR